MGNSLVLISALSVMARRVMTPMLSAGMGGFFSVFSVFFIAILLIVVFSVAKAVALNSVMRRLGEEPTQENAELAVAEFTRINPIIRWNLSLACDSQGVSFTMWRAVFNNNVIPSKKIRWETKEALRKAMIRVNTYGLRHVNPPRE